MMYLTPFIWFIYLTLISVLMAPLWAILFPNLSRFQIQLLSKPLSFFISHFFFWMFLYFIPSLNLLALLVLLPLVVFHIKNKTYRSVVSNDFKIELFLFVLFICLYVFSNSLSLPIWGEKPMDMGVLQTLLRTPTALVNDPWLAGHSFHYYYLGAFSYGFMGNLLGTSPSHLYLLSHSFNFFLFVCAVIVAAWHWVKKPIDRVLTALGVLFSLNIVPLLNLFSHDGVLTKFWNISRVFGVNRYFVEYPIWSYLLADFHPHYIAYPITFIFIFSLLITKNASFALSVFWGVLLALLIGLNSWDFIFCFILLVLWDLKNRLRSVAIAGIVSGLLALPWILILSSGKSIEFGFQEDLVVVLTGMLKHQLLFIFFIIFGVIRTVYLKHALRWKELTIYAVILLGICFTYFMDPTNTVFKFGSGLTILAMVLLSFYGKHVRYLFLINIAIFALLIISLSSFFHFPSNDYLLLYSKKTKQNARKLNQACHQQNCTLLEWPDKTYDYSRMQLSSLTGLPSYLGQTQQLLVRNTSSVQTVVSSRRSNLKALFSQEHMVDNRKVYLCKGSIEEDISLKSLIKQCDFNVSF